MMLTIDLQGKVALVLGGSRGIGAAITRMLCKAGVVTIFTHTGNPEYQDRVESLLERIRKEGGEVSEVQCDACDASRTATMVNDIVNRQGKLDILVANVGQNLARAAEDVTDDEWCRFIDMNLSSAFYGVRAVLPHMLKSGGGRIILIGSSAVYDGGGGAIDYAAAKAGLDGMMKYLAKNYARKGIVTNVIHPGVIETDLLRERYSDEDKRTQLIAQVPVGRLGRPEDIAWLVAYLASSGGDFICGQSILVDGGRTLYRS